MAGRVGFVHARRQVGVQVRDVGGKDCVADALGGASEASPTATRHQRGSGGCRGDGDVLAAISHTPPRFGRRRPPREGTSGPFWGRIFPAPRDHRPCWETCRRQKVVLEVLAMPFRDRTDAGRRLAARLRSMHGADVVVLGLPRGGVPVAVEVARALDAPLDVILVRKLGVPTQPELAMGAIGEGGIRIANQDVVRAATITRDQWDTVEERGRAELERRARRFRGDRRRVPLVGRTAVLVDDGIATGSTAWAACQVARALGAERVVLAVPVAASQSIEKLGPIADEIVCLEVPPDFRAVGEWYDDFSQTTDEQVVSILIQAAGQPARRGHDHRRRGAHRPGSACGPPHGSRRCEDARGLRPRQGQQPAQPTQPIRRSGAQPSRAGNAAVRSPHPG